MTLEFRYQVGEEVRSALVERQGDVVQVTVGDLVARMPVRQAETGRLDLETGARRTRAFTAHGKAGRYVSLDGQTYLLFPPAPAAQRRSQAGPAEGRLTATMPGRVLDVLVEPGQAVAKGDTLVLLEAMKMELRIQAPLAGAVASVHCTAGQVVERGAVLVEIQPQES